MATTTLPPGPSVPNLIQGMAVMAGGRRTMRRLRDRYGDAFTLWMPILGPTVVVSAPAEVRQLFQTPADVADYHDVMNLGRVLGPGSLFALSGAEHRAQRKLLVPPFHGRRLRAYEAIVEEETLRELASWPENVAFASQPSMMRITLNIILRAVFGADGAEFAHLRELLPRAVTLGSRLALLPRPSVNLGRWSPWARLDALRCEYGEIIDRMITRAEADQRLDERDDVLALLVRSRYEDGSAMTRGDIADELITMLAAGHETTATTLAWVVERLRRHPTVLRDLVDEVDAGGSTLREATLLEVLRTRPVITQTLRQVKADSMTLGRWTVPKGHSVFASIALIHEDDAVFPDAHRFDPTRFVGTKPDLYQWVPFGGGHRRCIGAAFATMEMNIVLRTILREVTLVPTADRDERWQFRGIAYAPGRGGRAVVRRRTGRQAPQSVAATGGRA
ncbi:hypothetical protein SAMN05216174_101514 [Actinokineospora iranica]|uniref:Cytochrome P450 n=2 Tax=Actinokineospora iranica TaxID=1271860 RepID=A0A1G6JSJ2_9PSEU|nr:hypothetical protein SAMN05216174_101514 [Actinokineospora iranica]